MTDYRIETKVLSSGKIRSRLSKDGRPTKVDSLIPRYQQIYKSITEVQTKTIIELPGNLEKIATTFSI